MARLSKEHYAAVERAETPVKSSTKNRFTNIFKSSSRKSSPDSSVNTAERNPKLKPGVLEVGLHAADMARLSNVDGTQEEGASSPFPLTMEDAKPQELVSWTAVDKTLDLSGTTNAEELVDEWQAELEKKKEDHKLENARSSGGRRSEIPSLRTTGGHWSRCPHSEDEEGGIVDSWDKHMADISSQSNPRSFKNRKADLCGQKEDRKPYANLEDARHHTMDELVEVDPEWLSYSPEEDEKGMIDPWSKRVDGVFPKSTHYSHYDRESSLGSIRSFRATEKVTSVSKNTVNSPEEYVAGVLGTRCTSTPKADQLCSGREEHSDIEMYRTAQTFSPIMEEYITELGEIIQENRVMDTEELDVKIAEEDVTQVESDLDDDASLDSIPSPSKLIVDTALLQQLYEHGVPTPEGVQFYVNRKIQEAIHAHENKLHTPFSHRHIHAPKALKIGPILITDPALVSYTTQAIRLIHYAILFATTVAGPKTFFVWVWKMAIFCGVYEVVTRELGWKDEETPDLLLEPLYHGFKELLGVGENAALRLGYMLGPFIGEIVKGVVDGDEGCKDKEE
jgi:hypothetical protein